MATLVTTMRESLKREINIPGFEQLPDIGNTQLDGYIKDGFWEARLLGLLGGYVLTDGTEFATPSGEVIYKLNDADDLPQQYQMLIVILAAFRLLRMRLFSLAVNFKAEAGPVSYEQQASATVLRALLESLERRVEALKVAYFDLFGASTFIYFDGELQREASILGSFAELTTF